MKTYWAYIMTSGRNGTLYIGVTNNLSERVQQHQNKINPNSFTATYNVNQLVYAEECGDINDAIAREKQLKSWNRKWKIELIEQDNPHWNDLSENL